MATIDSVNVVIQTLAEYDRRTEKLKRLQEINDSFEEALYEAKQGREVVVSMVDPDHWRGVAKTWHVINPSDHVKELKAEIDRLQAENKRLIEKKKEHNEFSFWDWLTKPRTLY